MGTFFTTPESPAEVAATPRENEHLQDIDGVRDNLSYALNNETRALEALEWYDTYPPSNAELRAAYPLADTAGIENIRNSRRVELQVAIDFYNGRVREINDELIRLVDEFIAF